MKGKIKLNHGKPESLLDKFNLIEVSYEIIINGKLYYFEQWVSKNKVLQQTRDFIKNVKYEISRALS